MSTNHSNKEDPESYYQKKEDPESLIKKKGRSRVKNYKEANFFCFPLLFLLLLGDDKFDSMVPKRPTYFQQGLCSI